MSSLLLAVIIYYRRLIVIERQINLNDAFDPSRITVEETRQNRNDPHSQITKVSVKIDGTVKPFAAITSLYPLIENYYLSPLDTCQSRVIFDSYLGDSQTESQWRGNPTRQLKNRLANMHPFEIIKSVSSNNEVISIDFIGIGDIDTSNVDGNFENNILYQVARDTKYANHPFPRNFREYSETGHRGLPVLIQNGSGTGERHGLASEKHIIENMVKLFNAAHTKALAQIRTQTQDFARQLTAHLQTYTNDNRTIRLFEPNPDPKKPNMKGKITELGQQIETLLNNNFQSSVEKFDAQQVLVEFDDSYIAFPSVFSEEGKTDFVGALTETLEQHLPTYMNFPFNVNQDDYNFNFENTHVQISNGTTTLFSVHTIFIYAHQFT